MSYAHPFAAARFYTLVTQLVREQGNGSAAARMLGVSTSYVAKIVRGEGAGKVRLATLIDAAERLGIPPNVLLEPDSDFVPENWRLHRKRPVEERSYTAEAVDTARLQDAARELEFWGEGSSPEDYRDLARRFLGREEIALAEVVRDASDQDALRLGPILAKMIRRLRLS